MTRRIYLLAPSTAVFALLACGGANDPGLFSDSGPSAGNHGTAAGASASAGAAAAPPIEGGATATAGSANGAGQPSGGSSVGGSSSAGADTGGSAESAVQAGAGGSIAGAGGSSAGAGGSRAGAGGSSAGTAGSIETAGSSGNAGSGGNEPTCAALLAQAATQLEAARACSIARNVTQCTGVVKTTCNCDVPVESQNSAETQAYEATLKQLKQQKCVQVCSAIACIPASHGLCRSSSVASYDGSCVANAVVASF